jgi:opacity protein-like surface antigen
VTRPDSRNASRSRIALPLLTTLALALATPALAADENEDDARGDWYVEYMVGVSHVPKQTLRSTDAVPVLSGSTKSDSAGYFVGGAIGRRFGEYFRTELQIGYRSTDIEEMAVRGEPNDADSGRLSLFTAMANGYFDFDLADQGLPLTPWVGLGLGWGMPRLDAQNSPGANQMDVDDTDSVFVYSFMTGLSIRISEITDATLGYRYIRTEDFEIGGTSAGAARRFDYEYDAHEASVGIRFYF